MTTLLDIYEAGGGTVNEDRTQVTVTSAFKPFDIVLRVIPTEMSMMNGEAEQVTFSILLASDVVLDGNAVRHLSYDVDVKLPVNQVRIKKTPETPGPETPYDGRPLDEIIEEFVLVRGDLSEEYARRQLARVVLRSAEVRSLLRDA